MSKDIIVLTPNGRRQKVHCNADTSILQILEDVCQKQGFPPIGYGLKHHNHILDLTNTVRFSNLPNKATLEMVETDERTESNVVIGLMLEDGDRRTAEFSPNTSLYELIISLALKEFQSLQNPTIIYMRQEVTGPMALKEKTLRQLGLIGGRAVLRLLDKPDEATQANVSHVYRRLPVKKEDLESNKCTTHGAEPGPSDDRPNKSFDPIKMIKLEREKIPVTQVTNDSQENNEGNENQDDDVKSKIARITKCSIQNQLMEVDEHQPETSGPSSTIQEQLERRLRIEEEVTFVGSRKAIIFKQPEQMEAEWEDLPDDFYELSLEEVRKLYHELQEQRMQLENAPLITAAKKGELEDLSSQERLNMYKNVVVRIQFPDQIILQGVFGTDSTIEEVTNFVKEHLHNCEYKFLIFTTPLKETLDPKTTLYEARFVPCVHMHFKWLEEDRGAPYLKEELLAKLTSSDAAGILASKYRAPNRKKMDEATTSSQRDNSRSSTSKSSKVPKWFKV